jgi:hypothetical protein
MLTQEPEFTAAMSESGILPRVRSFVQEISSLCAVARLVASKQPFAVG